MTTDGNESSSDVTPSAPWIVHQGDSRQLSSLLQSDVWDTAGIDAEAPVQCTITSPPYADLKSYEGEDAQIGHGDDYEAYLDELRDIFRSVYEATRPDGSLWIVVDNFVDAGRIVPLPDDLIRVCENLQNQTTCPVEGCDGHLRRRTRSGDGVCATCGAQAELLADSWRLHDEIIWHKGKARPFSGEAKFRNSHETILCFTKSDSPKFYPDRVRIADPESLTKWWIDWPERYHPRGINPDNVWEIDSHTRGAWGNSNVTHPAAFPPQLVARILRFATDREDIVLDPFAGSGTVVAQANAMDRRGVGIELGQSYVDGYPVVAEEVHSRWEELKQAAETQQDKQARLAQTIWGLRQLVYAKKLVQHLRDTLQYDTVRPLGLHSVFVTSNTPEPGIELDTIQTEYTFLIDPTSGSTSIDTLTEHLHAAQGTSPWTDFALETTIRTVAISEDTFQSAGENCPFSDSLYLYPRGDHAHFSRRIGLSDWSRLGPDTVSWWDQFASRSYPPLLSNLAVRVDRGDDEHSIPEPNDLLSEPPEQVKGSFAGEIVEDHEATRITDY